MNKFSPNSVAINTFKGIRDSIIKPVVLALPLLLEQSSVISENSFSHHTELKQNAVNTYSDVSISNDEIQSVLNMLTENLGDVKKMIDLVISFSHLFISEITDDELWEFGNEVAKFNQFYLHIEKGIKEFRIENDPFMSSLQEFGNKIEELYSSMYSEKFKQHSDVVILNRNYKGKESVGYRFSSNHSFNDFKKAVLG